VSGQVFDALAGASSDAARAEARERVSTAIVSQARAEYAPLADSLYVQVVDLYGGGRYSVYVFRRFTDVRLVFAVEVQMGFFGGDPDNFTYPRYALDFAFLRIYEDGVPYSPEHQFGWGEEGVEEGDAVFVIGNPGETNRLATMDQIRLQAEVTVPASIAWFESTHRALGDFYEADPEQAEAMGVRDMRFSLSNSLKAYRGRAAALQDRTVVARKAAGEAAFVDSIEARPALAAEVGGVLEEVARIQEQKRRLGPAYAAFLNVTSATFSAATIRRAFNAYAYVASRNGGAPESSLEQLRGGLTQVRDLPEPLERGLLESRLAAFARYLPDEHAAARFVAEHGSPSAAADALLRSPLARASSTATALEGGALTEADPVVRLGAAMLPAYAAFAEEWNELTAREGELTVELGRARFDIFGESIPPDGTFSPRITDGVVRGYEYNGTVAPPYTTFFGVWDRAIGHGESVDWSLPPRWQTPPAGLDLSTPLNFVSTADTYGGNSGSPAVTRALDLVGLNFDRNINGLSRDYIYLPEQGRNVMVDVRAIEAALTHAYGAQRIVDELERGGLTP
ncbi:MAG TPA: S46 family peptidase, partial [Longimicrobiales bacterium]|nr:S46 family peptidase [Longimicrobiales bacterium]